MNVIRTRLHVAADGTITGLAPGEVPPGDHEAEILVTPGVKPSTPLDKEKAWAAIRAVQARVAQLPVLDPRTPEEILGYDRLPGVFD